MRCRLATVFCATWVCAAAAFAQQDPAQIGARLLQDAAVKAALESIKAAEPQTLEDQIRLCEVEAPPFKETKRAQVYAQMFRDIGLANVRIDKEGNVLGERRGSQPKPHLVFSAHLDTVFPEGTPVTVKRDGNDPARPRHRRRLPRPRGAARGGAHDRQGQPRDARHHHLRRHGRAKKGSAICAASNTCSARG